MLLLLLGYFLGHFLGVFGDSDRAGRPTAAHVSKDIKSLVGVETPSPFELGSSFDERCGEMTLLPESGCLVWKKLVTLGSNDDHDDDHDDDEGKGKMQVYPWVRLIFSEETSLVGDAYLRIVSLRDGYYQYLTAVSLLQWYHTSAYFNGDSVMIELYVYDAKEIEGVHVSVKEVVHGIPQLQSASLCGDDTRNQTEYRRSGRLLSEAGGCTGWLIMDPGKCFLTAEHCDTHTGGVMEFQVPLSNPTPGGGYEIVHPHPSDQYSIDLESVQQSWWYYGNDWAHQGLFPNSNTGLTAYEAQGDAYVLSTSTVIPAVNTSLRITGYGIVDDPIPVELNQVQQSGLGYFVKDELRDAAPTCPDRFDPVKWELYYRVDTTGGNSGGAVEDMETGLAIAVHTHGGCGRYSGENSGTFAGNPCLQAAVANPQGVCAVKAPVLLPPHLRATSPIKVPTTATNPSTNLVRGVESNWESFRGVVAVKSSLGLCSGTLIDPEIVLTAWHCLTSNFESYEILGGADINEAPVFIAGVIAGNGQWDTAILRLDRNVTTIPFYDIRLNNPATQPERGDFGYLVGYGYTQVTPNLGLGVHRYGTSTIYSVASDGERFNIMGNPTSACNGDSGGPFLMQEPSNGKWVVTGVTSMADSGCREGEITIYDNIFGKYDYIQDSVFRFTGHYLTNQGHPGDLPQQ